MLNFGNVMDIFRPQKQSPWTRKRRVGKNEVIIKAAFYGKKYARLLWRKLTVVPVTSTASKFKSADGRALYEVWSDGSLRKMRVIHRRGGLK